MLLSGSCYAQTSNSTCITWQSKVEEETSLHLVNTKEMSQEEVFLAIECLLELKGRKDDSNISVTRSDVSPIFQATSVEVAALYYISYIFKQEWGHADAAFLRTTVNRKFNECKTVSKAFKAYENWFKSIKKIGLEEARKQKLDPLADTGISWY